jgi:hypothetical protein
MGKKDNYRKNTGPVSEGFNLFSFFAFILDIFKGIFSLIAAFFSLFF